MSRPVRCAHANTAVEIHEGDRWIVYGPEKGEFWRGIDFDENPRVVVVCTTCNYCWQVREGSINRTPKWVREPARAALDRWWENARDQGPYSIYAQVWQQRKAS